MLARLVLLLSYTVAEREQQPLSEQIPSELLSVRGLSAHITRLIPHRAGMALPMDVRPDGAELVAPLLKFDTAGAVNVSAFRDAVLRREGYILNTTAARKGLLSLVSGKTVKLTSRSDRYNIFFWDEPWVGDYYWAIKRAFHAYIARNGVAITKPLYIHSWANCFREGQIKWHAHGPDDVEAEGLHFFSGTFAVAVPVGTALRTATIYKPERAKRYQGGFTPAKTQVVRNVNTAGDLVIFDSMLHHQSTQLSAAQLADLAEHARAPCRITSSWDITNDPLGIFHSVPFYDPADPEWQGGQDDGGQQGGRQEGGGSGGSGSDGGAKKKKTSYERIVAAGQAQVDEDIANQKREGVYGKEPEDDEDAAGYDDATHGEQGGGGGDGENREGDEEEDELREDEDEGDDEKDEL